MSAPQLPKPTRIDGRRLRSERTKQLIIEAYLALAHEFSPRVPTAAEIAERAGYSVRSVFERFPDIRALQIAAVDYAVAQLAALGPPRGADGDRPTRLEAQVTTRAQICERWLPLWRSLVFNQGNSSSKAFRWIGWKTWIESGALQGGVAQTRRHASHRVCAASPDVR